MTRNIIITPTQNSNIKSVDLNNIPFGKLFSDHILVCDYENGAWQDVKIIPFSNFTIHPACMALHYGQTIFEGMKAYKTIQGDAVIFRPKENHIRFNKSAKRMCMPEIPEDVFVDGLKALVKIDSQWIPTTRGSSMYLRPFMFANDEAFGVKASEKYRFAAFCSPVNTYYTEPLKVKIEEYYIRAASGGAGEAKNGGNYGISLYPASLAQKEGFKQILWTDGKEHKWIEESGTMNVFFKIGDEIVTPALNGNILDGVTRKSVLQLLKDKGYKVTERPVSVEEVVSACRNNTLLECFGTGTAATIAQIIGIGFRDELFNLPPIENRAVTQYIIQTLDDIKYGVVEDTYKWIEKV